MKSDFVRYGGREVVLGQAADDTQVSLPAILGEAPWEERIYIGAAVERADTVWRYRLLPSFDLAGQITSHALTCDYEWDAHAITVPGARIEGAIAYLYGMGATVVAFQKYRAFIAWLTGREWEDGLG